MITFGFVIKLWRETDSISQKVLAAKVGISAQYLCDIENGRRNPPPDELLEKLAAVLDCPAEYLYYMANRIPPALRNQQVLVSTVVSAWRQFESAIQQEGAE